MRQARTRVTVGLATLLLAAFAAPSTFAQTSAPQTRRNFVVRNGGPSRIGVSIREVTAADVSGHKLPGEFGAYVTEVTGGGPAQKAGIQANDVIVEFDRVRVRSSAELERLVRETPAGRAVNMGVIRDGKRIDVTVTTEADNAQLFNFNGRDYRFDIPNFDYRVLPPEQPGQPFSVEPGQRFRVFREPLRVYPVTLGISLHDLTPQLADYFKTKAGVLVATVNDGSPAARAGVKAGDIITSVDGQQVTRGNDVTRAVWLKHSGDQVTLGVVRDGKSMTLKVTL